MHSCRSHEPLRDRVHARGLRRGRYHLDTAGREHRVERGRELGVPVSDQVGEPAPGVGQVGGEFAGQLDGPGCGREPGDAQKVHLPHVVLKANATYRRRRVTAQSTWKKSTASMLVAWVRRNCRLVVSVYRTDAGGMRWRVRIRRIVEAPTR
jgi:hypothetical protein